MKQKFPIIKIDSVEFNVVEAKKMKKDVFVDRYGKRLQDVDAAFKEIAEWKAPEKKD